MNTKRRGEFTFHKDIYARSAGFIIYAGIVAGGWTLAFAEQKLWGLIPLGIGVAIYFLYRRAGDLVTQQYSWKIHITGIIGGITGLAWSVDLVDQQDWDGLATGAEFLAGLAILILLFGSVFAIPIFIANRNEAKKSRKRAKPDNSIVGLLKQGFSLLMGFFMGALGVEIIVRFIDGFFLAGLIAAIVPVAILIGLVLSRMFWSDAQKDDMGDLVQFGVITGLVIVSAIQVVRIDQVTEFATEWIDVQGVIDAALIVVRVMFGALLVGLLLNSVIIWRGFSRVVLGRGK